METSQTRRLFESIVKMKKSVAIYQKDKLMLDPTAFPLQIIAKFSEQNDDQLGVKMSIIGHVLGISKPGTTALIDNLEKKGYVNRSLNKDDRRVVYVNLTEAGRNALLGNEDKMNATLVKVIEAYGEEDTDDLIRLLDKLSLVLDDVRENYSERKE